MDQAQYEAFLKEQRFQGYLALIGARNAPENALKLMVRLGKFAVDLRFGVSSGDAVGCDRAGYAGAIQSKRFGDSPSRIFLPWSPYFNYGTESLAAPERYLYDANEFVNTYTQAASIARTARGGFGGLTENGQRLMTRNSFILLGQTLGTPAKAVFYWAEPKQEDSAEIKGGTGVAITIARKFDIREYNLYYKDVRFALDRVLNHHEQWVRAGDIRPHKAWIDPRRWGKVGPKHKVDPNINKDLSKLETVSPLHQDIDLELAATFYGEQSFDFIRR